LADGIRGALLLSSRCGDGTETRTLSPPVQTTGELKGMTP
jgi:hypothetical protein